LGKSVRAVPTSLLQDTLAAQGAEFGRTVGEPNQQLIDEVGQLPFHEPPTTGDRDPVSAGASSWVRN
jgi:hypothetical protein